ncbi:MAG: OmpA family protein [Vampirovibrio sp.]|nr:OmpA family protein [Vampirovibrio sp.]
MGGIRFKTMHPLHPQKQKADSYLSSDSSSNTVWQRLDRLEQESGFTLANTGQSRWMIPYADLLTLMLGFFVVLYALSSSDMQSLQNYSDNMAQSLVKTKTQLVQNQAALNAIQSHDRTLSEEKKQPKKPVKSKLPVQKKPEITAEKIAQNQRLAILADRKELTVREENRGLVVSMLNGVLFEPGQSELTGSAKAALDSLAEILKSTSHSIVVEGHTDDSPIATAQFPSNWELSTNRATQIVKYLVQKHRLDPGRLSAAGYGEFRPVVSNSSVEGKRKNRRVDIVVLKGRMAESSAIESAPEQATSLISKDPSVLISPAPSASTTPSKAPDILEPETPKTRLDRITGQGA